MHPYEQLKQQLKTAQRRNLELCQVVAVLKANADLRSQALASILRAFLRDPTSTYLREVAERTLHRYDLERSLQDPAIPGDSASQISEISPTNDRG